MGLFPETHYSAVLAARGDDPVLRRESMERLARGYYSPIYKHLRLKWRKDEDTARDLAQDFFAKVVDQSLFEVYDPTRTKFRTFLRRCLDNFVINDHEARTRQKRGGGVEPITFDTAEAESELSLVSPDADPEACFDREVARTLVAGAVDTLRERLAALGKERVFEAFASYDLVEPEERPTYADLAARLEVQGTTLTNWLHGARKEFRVIVLSKLRELTASEEEFRDEAMEMLNFKVS